jgi:hypothetical protein
MNGARRAPRKNMSDIEATNLSVQPRLRSALERAKPKFSVIPKEDLQQITLDPLSMTATVQGSLPKIMVLREQILSEAPKFDISNLDQLETYALALLQAQSEHVSATIPPEEIAKLGDEATQLREFFLADATALGKRGYINVRTLNELSGTVGYKNVAGDVLVLAAIFRHNWATISSKTGVTEAELDRAEVIGDQLIRAVGVREQGPAKVAAATLERQQAYTLFVNTYNQVRRVVNFLRWDDGDADDIAPSLYAGRTSKKKTDADAPVEVPAQPQVAAPTHTNVTTSNTSPTSPSTKTTGFPDSDPFLS